MSTTTGDISRYTPSNLPRETLEALFVQREALAADTIDRIRDSALSGNIHNILLVGPRGCGKTHFVSLIAHRLADDAALQSRLRVAWLNEDETTTSFFDLLLRIHRALQIEHPAEFPAETVTQLYGTPAESARKPLETALLSQLGDRKCLVIVENIDAVFQGLGLAGQHDLRAFLLQHPQFPLLATAQRLDASLSSRDEPFFGFFEVHPLQPLHFEEAMTLLASLARLRGNEELLNYLQDPEGRARVRALHHLAGGNHRIYVVLADFIDREALDQLVRPMEMILDELTPYYQERLRSLSPQQRKIVELLSLRSQPMAVKEIAERLFASQQTIASQLKTLRELGDVQSHERGRESLHELTDPLMRMSIEDRESRGATIPLIVNFLRGWYSARANDDPESAHPGGSTTKSRVLSLAASGRWSEVWSALQKSAKRPSTGVEPQEIAALIHQILRSGADREAWQMRITKLRESFATPAAAARLGQGLVDSLALLKDSGLAPDTLAAWRETWAQAASGDPALQIPLQVFSSGLQFLRTGDPKSLLDLPLELRPIAAAAVGLPTNARLTGA